MVFASRELLFQGVAFPNRDWDPSNLKQHKFQIDVAPSKDK